MPSDLRFAERIVVQVLIPRDLCFERYIFPNVKSTPIKEERCEQTAHSSVSVVKRMNTEKIVNEYRDCYERLQLVITDYSIKLITYAFERGRCFKGIERSEQRSRTAVGIGCANVILYALCSTCHGVVHMAIQNFMELQNVIGSNRDGIKALVDDI